MNILHHLRFVPAKLVRTSISLSWNVKVILILGLLFIGVVGYLVFSTVQKPTIRYETATVEKGTLVSSITGSGTITSGNYTAVTTKTSGTVTQVYVTNGDTVVKGQKIADIALDDYAKERQSAAWVSYLAANEDYLTAVSEKAAVDIAMWTAREEILNAEEAIEDMNTTPTNPKTKEVYTEGEKAIITKTLEQKRLAYTAVETTYKDADARIINAQAKAAAAYRTYQENSATIVAPADGVITDLALAQGITVSASSTTSSTSGATIVSAQTVGKVNDKNGRLIASVSLTESDIIHVQANQKVAITLDAYEDASFTGSVLAVSTSGNVNSGVTSYPVTILLDPVDVAVYPAMAVSVEILTHIKPNVLLIPTTAIQDENNSHVVQVMNNGVVQTVTVEIGDANDSQTEIVSGLSEGATVVTSTIQDTAKTGSTTSSPFSSSNRSGNSRSTQGTTRIFMGNGPGGF